MYYLPLMKAFISSCGSVSGVMSMYDLSIFESSSANSGRCSLGTSDPCTAPLTLPPFAYIFSVGVHCKFHCFCIIEYFVSHYTRRSHLLHHLRVA
jgi:hypothetical protein